MKIPNPSGYTSRKGKPNEFTQVTFTRDLSGHKDKVMTHMIQVLCFGPDDWEVRSIKWFVTGGDDRKARKNLKAEQVSEVVLAFAL